MPPPAPPQPSPALTNNLASTQSLIATATTSVNDTLNSLRHHKRAANDRKRREIQELKMERLREKVEAERYNCEIARAKKVSGVDGRTGELADERSERE